MFPKFIHNAEEEAGHEEGVERRVPEQIDGHRENPGRQTDTSSDRQCVETQYCREDIARA